MPPCRPLQCLRGTRHPQPPRPPPSPPTAPDGRSWAPARAEALPPGPPRVPWLTAPPHHDARRRTSRLAAYRPPGGLTYGAPRPGGTCSTRRRRPRGGTGSVPRPPHPVLGPGPQTQGPCWRRTERAPRLPRRRRRPLAGPPPRALLPPRRARTARGGRTGGLPRSLAAPQEVPHVLQPLGRRQRRPHRSGGSQRGSPAGLREPLTPAGRRAPDARRPRPSLRRAQSLSQTPPPQCRTRPPCLPTQGPPGPAPAPRSRAGQGKASGTPEPPRTRGPGAPFARVGAAAARAAGGPCPSRSPGPGASPYA